MRARSTAISQRESYHPSRFTEFLWWLSTAEKEILVDSVIDRNRYRIIGMCVLATWAFASFTWTYFFSTITTSIFLSIALGFFMGFIILTIDRALIKGINKSNKKKFMPLLIRGLLALTIGTFMAQPAVLYMFDKEIRLQSSLDNEKKKQVKRQELDALYSNRKKETMLEKENLEKELAEKYDAVSKSRENFLAETDGSGGTGKIGLKEIAIAKRNEYEKLDAAYQALLAESKPKLDSANAVLASMEKEIGKAETEFTTYLNNGFLTRVEALNNILKNNSALQYRYFLIVFILVLIELMPVVAKIMLPSGSYDEKVILREEMEIEIARANALREKNLKETYNQLAFENDSEMIASFFTLSRDDRQQKIKDFSKEWKAANNQSFDGFWEKMKQEILTKQEN